MKKTQKQIISELRAEISKLNAKNRRFEHHLIAMRRMSAHYEQAMYEMRSIFESLGGLEDGFGFLSSGEQADSDSGMMCRILGMIRKKIHSSIMDLECRCIEELQCENYEQENGEEQ